MSTLKVNTITTVDGTGNITVSRPLSGSGASLTNLPAANLTGALPAISGAALTNLPAGAADEITTQTSDPTVSSPATPTLGDVILNTTSGEMFTCTTVSSGANIWVSVGSVAANLTGALPAISGASLTALNATQLTSGTLPDARFGTLPAVSGVNLTALNATNLGSGTLPDARFPATLPATSGANLTALPAGNLTGTVADARISALTASKLTGALPAISGASLTNLPAPANNSVGLAQLAAGTDGNIITYDASGDPAHVATGTAGHVLTSGGTGVAPTFVAAAAGGKIVQVVNTSVTSVVTGTTAMPVDNTIPQSGEGVELITRAITPTSASNKLLFFVSLEIKNTNTGGIQTIALFQDSTANALAAVYGKYMYASANQWPSQSFQHYMTAGTTSSTTFKIRSGQDGSGTTTLNGQAGNRLYGGVSSSNLTIMEISV